MVTGIDKIKNHEDMAEVKLRPTKGLCLICARRLKGETDIGELYYPSLGRKVNICKNHIKV